MPTKFKAGYLSRFVPNWHRTYAPQNVLQWLTEGVPAFKDIQNSFMLHNHVLNKEQKQFVRTEIKDLLSCGAIEECQELPRCVSPNGCVPKIN